MRRFDFTRMLARLRRDRSGVAAVEFSLLAPVLCFGCIATVDLGMALGERIAIDHVLRTGVASAMRDEGQTQVRKILVAAGRESFDVVQGSSGSADTLAVDAVRYCACPDNTGAAVACTTVCAGSLPTYVYYRLTARKIYSGMIVPDISFDASTRVQAR